ncbi:MAG: succinate dehydrogenase, hydrophobic membrane anchor protein [Gammaproteobacteria bacterium]|nr:succinate dehydrogenase, hydrophobic membrane anchor protein [Gammaproteobacteria bacterium]
MTNKTNSVNTHSAHKGSGHFLKQKFSAMILIPIVLWFCFSIAIMPSMDYEYMLLWLKSPYNYILLSITLITGFYHLQLGLQMIIEDYIAEDNLQRNMILMTKWICIMLCVVGLISLFYIVLG